MTEHATLTPFTRLLVLLYGPIRIAKRIVFNHARLGGGKHRGIDDNKAIFHHQILWKILDLNFFRNYKSLEGETTKNIRNQPTFVLNANEPTEVP